MKFQLNINQPQALNLGITHITLAHIFDLLTTASTWANNIIIEDEVYYWVARQTIIAELPLLPMKPDTVRRHLNTLCKLGVIDYKLIGKKDCIRLTQKGKKYLSKGEENTMSDSNSSKGEFKSVKSANTDSNSSKGEFKSVKTPKKANSNPTYPSTILYPSTNDTYMHEWNLFASKNSLSKISVLSDNRKKRLQMRLKNSDFKRLFETALVEIPKSQYLLGAKGWKITFDWLIKNDENILKVIEGNYRDKSDKKIVEKNKKSLLNNLPAPQEYVIDEKW